MESQKRRSFFPFGCVSQKLHLDGINFSQLAVVCRNLRDELVEFQHYDDSKRRDFVAGLRHQQTSLIDALAGIGVTSNNVPAGFSWSDPGYWHAAEAIKNAFASIFQIEVELFGIEQTLVFAIPRCKLLEKLANACKELSEIVDIPHLNPIEILHLRNLPSDSRFLNKRYDSVCRQEVEWNRDAKSIEEEFHELTRTWLFSNDPDSIVRAKSYFMVSRDLEPFVGVADLKCDLSLLAIATTKGSGFIHQQLIRARIDEILLRCSLLKNSILRAIHALDVEDNLPQTSDTGLSPRRTKKNSEVVMETPCVKLFGPDNPPAVKGTYKTKLTPEQYATVSALVEDYPKAEERRKGLSKERLEHLADCDAVKVLTRLKSSDKDWGDVLLKAGKKGCGYRIK